jgi:copper chaperone CopZ
MATTTLRVDGMSCDKCARAVAAALEKIPGVSQATVSLGERRAVVEHTESAPAVALMIDAAAEEGYSAVAE